MGRLTRAEATAHREALGLAGLRRDLDEEEKRFVLTHFQESASATHPLGGAFFTPEDLADCMSLDVVGNRVIDLCAGIGALAFACRNLREQSNGLPARELVCVESNPEFVAVGMKLVPEATWVCADVFDIGRQRWRLFDTAIANPPFGNHTRTGNAPGYRGPRFEYYSDLLVIPRSVLPSWTVGHFQYNRLPILVDQHAADLVPSHRDGEMEVVRSIASKTTTIGRILLCYGAVSCTVMIECSSRLRSVMFSL
ncbi:hypothetical protein [Nocardia abscessus]|uniref:hypothetical protein n=1 Tax=Nocardia abscessus TaxID=120957 RepID=UPI002458768C|nr:hypothetical protein [Nocardia abscessus]